MKKAVFLPLILLAFTTILLSQTIVQNPIISRNKVVYSSAGNITYLTDNKFGGSSFSVINNSWLAIKLPTSPSKLFFSWNNPAYSWSDVIAAAHSCKGNYTFPVNYALQTSSNSTNGSDGAWTTVISISGNNVTTRGHLIDFTGMTWVKMSISTGGGTLDEIEVFDASNNGNDLWFFVGTSISANTYKSSPPAKNFADLIAGSFTGFNPAMVRGGIPCINSGDFDSDISKYLNSAKGVKYWAIEMGTNDAWGGSNYNVATFKTNMQLVIDSCKAAGIQPIIARMIGTNATAATWQVHPDYLAAIDSLTKKNNLIEGPDLYTWFTTHTSELNSDGVHPNATGAASIQRLWAQKMASLYPVAGVSVTGIHDFQSDENEVLVFPNPSNNGEFTLVFPTNTAKEATVEMYDEAGKLVYNTFATENELKIKTGLNAGIYVLKITKKGLTFEKKLVVK